MTTLRSRLWLMAAAGLLIWLFLFYSHSLVSRLEETNRQANETIAWFWAGTQIPFSLVVSNSSQAVCSECGQTRPYFGEARRFESLCSACGSTTRWLAVSRWSEEERQQVLDLTRGLFRRLVGRLQYSTVLTDEEGMPQIVNGEAVPDDVDPSVLRSYVSLAAKLDKLNTPIPLTGLQGDTIGLLHFGSGELAREMAVIPLIELGMLTALALVLLLGIRTEVRREKEMAWVGFAKETAHQLSTPISSLLGWLEILRTRPETACDPEVYEAVSCMSTDVERLGAIASRYGEMGKTPKLRIGDLNEVVRDTVSYFRDRQGLLSKGVVFETSLEAKRKVRLSPILLGWVLENLVKNALAALAGRNDGVISISTSDLQEGGGSVEILLSDNGKGVPFRDQGKIFSAGFTTRRGGWGLGLTLCKRIVEEYHGGRIRLVASSPGKGSTFSVQIPAERGKAEIAEQDDGTLGR
jgi:signal transduction histidine kinase